MIRASLENGLDDEVRARAEEFTKGLAVTDRAAATRSMAVLMEGADGIGGDQQIANVTARIAELDAQVSARRTWTFAVVTDQFLHDTLAGLQRDIERFRSASSLYGKDRHQDHPIDLPIQRGLVPIGKNPVTGLREFYASPPSDTSRRHCCLA